MRYLRHTSSMNNDERICSIALTLCPGIGHIGARRLIDGIGSAAGVFSQRKELPELLPGVSPTIVTALDNPAAFLRAEHEMEFVEKNRLTCLTLKDEAYPSRLRECEDAPIVLFFKGHTDFNRLRVINMVGTRNATEYGKQFCVDFLRDLSSHYPDVLVVSGLAYGIDIHAHRAALANNLSTVAVLAHGLDRIYPYVHRKTAIDMLANGGLLTEFLTETNPDRHNFVSRNRIVAGMTDATIVVESASKGGSLITADLAVDYHRDCFAVPGRTTDPFSMGCNRLIRDNKAVLIQSADDFMLAMGWTTEEEPAKHEGIQRSLFLELTEEEELVVGIQCDPDPSVFLIIFDRILHQVIHRQGEFHLVNIR